MLRDRPLACAGRSRRRVVASRCFWRQILGNRPPQPPALDKRDRTRIGQLECSAMGLGTWAMGNRFLWGYSEAMDAELAAVFNLALDRGVNLFDTADSYGTGDLDGRSEQLLGNFLRDYPGPAATRDRVVFATKFAAYPWRLLPSSVVGAARASRRRLRVERIGLGQLHWSAANYAPLQERALRAGIADCYDQGIISAVGVSNYGPKQLRSIHSYLAGRGVPLASAQVQLSLLSFGPQQREVLDACAELGVAVIAYSPLCLGLLTGKYSAEALPPGPRALLFRGLLPKVRSLLGTLEAVAEERRKTPSQVAINWAMCKGAIPIPGAKTLVQATDNLGALGWRLSAAEVAELDAAAAGAEGAMVQNVFQTS